VGRVNQGSREQVLLYLLVEGIGTRASVWERFSFLVQLLASKHLREAGSRGTRAVGRKKDTEFIDARASRRKSIRGKLLELLRAE